MSYTEAYYLIADLYKNPSSRLFAKKSEMDYPVTREWTLLAEIYDLLVAVNTDRKKGKPMKYPRPWKEIKKGARTIAKKAVSMAAAKEYFAKRSRKPTQN